MSYCVLLKCLHLMLHAVMALESAFQGNLSLIMAVIAPSLFPLERKFLAANRLLKFNLVPGSSKQCAALLVLEFCWDEPALTNTLHVLHIV